MPAGRGGGNGMVSGGCGWTSMSSANTGCNVIGTAANIASQAARLQMRRMPWTRPKGRPMLASVIIFTNFVPPEQSVQPLASRTYEVNPDWASHLALQAIMAAKPLCERQDQMPRPASCSGPGDGRRYCP